ncbi:MAG TPA: hypothetical protein VHO69_11280 [Phototrophicaceae bacterium]|nr:hypothetical protein [Phototrophicaceae bacterium]
MDELLTLAEFRRLRDWYGLKAVTDRLPKLEEKLKVTRRNRQRIKRQVEGYQARKERVPAHVEDELKAAAWAWQRADSEYTMALETRKRLLGQHPEWDDSGGNHA